MADVEAVPTPSEPLVVSSGVTEADPSAGPAAESSDRPAQPTPSTPAQADSNPAEAASPRASVSSQPDRPSSRTSSKASAAAAATAAASTSPPTPSPARRRPKPPTKGILKPPPPPAKPTLGNRLRDLASTVVSGSSKLFDADDPSSSSPRGGVTGSPATSPPSVSAAVGGTLNAISGRLGLGLSRFVAGTPSPSPGASPAGSPAPSRTALPETGAGSGSPQPHPQSAIVARQQPMSERSRQKQPLKRATFVLPILSITYPISSSGEPWSIKVIEDRKRIESTHRSLLSASTGAEYWTSARLITLYESACRGREERPRVGIVRALEIIPKPPRPRHIHLTLRPFDPTLPPSQSQSSSPNTLDIPLNRHAAEALADVLTSEWGLVDLKLEGGLVETEDALKPILHALLVSGTLPSLSLVGNRKIKAGGWRLLAVFLKKARSLRYIDLSDTTWDKKAIEYLVQALTCSHIRPVLPPKDAGSAPAVIPDDAGHTRDPPEADADVEAMGTGTGTGTGTGEDAYGWYIPPAPLLKEHDDETNAPAAVQTLRMDGCGLRPAVLETLAQGIRSSDLKNISLRRNRIGPLGAVALALMIRDYPDSALTMSSLTPTLSTTPSMHNPSIPNLDSSSPNPGYVTYAARSRRPISEALAAAAAAKDDDSSLPPIPLVVSSATGGVTSRTLPEGYKPPPPPKNPLVMPSGGNSAMQDSSVFGAHVTATQAEGKVFSPGEGASVALQRSVRALDQVERIGRLLTLDLKGNDIKNGVGYIAQVLKRNRTLKVLNLSDNKIDATGLAALAEALKYNSSLETLDMSSNPCCVTLEGIAALRTTFTVNTSLKRLFLSDTGLTSEGAISLAEFLPETKSLLHLDLTSNPLDVAGILAISVGLKSNTLIRCLDVSIPPNNPDLAELSQSILQSCIRNTELAASAMSGKTSSQEAIWGPIKKSMLVKQVKDAEQARAEKERVDLAQSPEGLAREFAYTLKPERVPGVSEQVARDIQRWFDAGAIARKPGFHAWEPGHLPKDDFVPLVEKAKALRERIVELIQETTDDASLESLLGLNDTLTSLLDKATTFNPLRDYCCQISSPNFSIGDSDNDSDAEELDVGRLPNQPAMPSPPLTPRPPRTPQMVNEGFVRTSSPLITGLVEEHQAELEHLQDHTASPVERASRAHETRVAEEEEVDEHQDVSGEELRQEILETEVARSPTRRVIQVDDEEEDVKAEDEGAA
ncbi:hypothetical protein EHS25_000765 [Saitozyma podzolica]|uniref:RNI-like protein n=1 Tax=Saitozyma podzolica TaxID=1890683 RepID=A0A427YX66_9TREE|nr:hypothetical protein EHS25_000765 [Saitozyma podzolica]